MAPARALSRIVVLRGHCGDQAVEARLTGELRVECRGDHVSLADRNDAAVFEAVGDAHRGRVMVEADVDANVDRRALGDLMIRAQL